MQPHDPSRPRAANVIPFTTAMPDAVFDRIIETVERDFVARHCPTIVIRTLSLPPSVNSAWLNIQGRGRVKSSAYRLWERESLKAIDKLYLPAVHPEAGLVVRWNFRAPISDRTSIIVSNPSSTCWSLAESLLTIVTCLGSARAGWRKINR